MDPALLGEVLSLLMFATACGVLILGFPVAFSLAGTALAFASLGYLLDVFNMNLLGGLPSRYFGVMVNEVLVAVPLFVFMGVMLERSRIAEQLLETMGMMFGQMRGGLGLSVVFVGMLLAASTGIVGATVVTMGLLALPTMLKSGYDPKLASGFYLTLLQLIPPDAKGSTSLFSTHPETRERADRLDELSVGLPSPQFNAASRGYADLKRVFPTREYFRRNPEYSRS